MQVKNTIRFIPLSLLVLFQGACNEEAIEWDLQTHLPDLLVVEGRITNERKAHEIILSRPVADPSDQPEPVSRAVVALFDGVRAELLEESSPGIYLTDSTYRAVISRIYRLYILLDGVEYSAVSRLVPVRRLNPLQYHRVAGGVDRYELDLQETDDASMVEILLDWSRVPGFRDLPADQTHARIVYYTVKSIDVNKIFRPSKEHVFFPAGTTVTRTKYSMNDSQENFVRTLMAETEWRGGYFDVQPGNVRTNLSEGAVGYFSVSAVVSDSSVILPLD